MKELVQEMLRAHACPEMFLLAPVTHRWLHPAANSPPHCPVGSPLKIPGPDLTRIVGYIPPSDVAAESESDGEDDAVEVGTVLDREWLKMRAAKLTARHNAKTAAAAAAAAQADR